MSQASVNWINTLKETLKASGHGSGTFQLATVKPDGFPSVRTVVFRGFLGQYSMLAENTSNTESASDLLTFTTHFKSSKVSEFKNNNKFELVWWFADQNLQYRISGYTHLIVSPKHLKDFPYPSQIEKKYSFISTQPTDDKPSQSVPVDWEALRISSFEQLSSAMRASFSWPTPGKKLTDEDSPEEFPYTYSEKHRTASLENYVLVLLEPIKVDLVELEKNNNSRTIYVKEQTRDENSDKDTFDDSAQNWHVIPVVP